MGGDGTGGCTALPLSLLLDVDEAEATRLLREKCMEMQAAGGEAAAYLGCTETNRYHRSVMRAVLFDNGRRVHRVSPTNLHNIHGNGNFIICGDLNFGFMPCYQNKRGRLVWRDPDCKKEVFYGNEQIGADDQDDACAQATSVMGCAICQCPTELALHFARPNYI